MVWFPEVRRVVGEGDVGEVYVVGHRLVDEFLRFAGGRARPNTVRAYAHDLKAFFSVVGKDPVEVRARDVLAFVTAQQQPRVGAENVTRISDGGSGLSAATVRRRLAAVSAFYGYLVARGDAGVDANPVPRGLPTRRRRRDGRGQPLVRAVRRLPRILEPAEVTALIGALRTARDRAMVQAMLLGGLRRCEVLGLRLEDLRLGEWRVFIAEGKGGHQRLVPVSTTFFTTVAGYLDTERPAGCGTDRVFVVLKGPNGDGHCRPTVSTRSSAPPGPGPGSLMAPVTSCATPV
jgi:site-specific recombinase XerD